MLPGVDIHHGTNTGKSVKYNAHLLRYLDTKRATKPVAYSRKVNGVSIQMFAVKHMLKQCAEL